MQEILAISHKVYWVRLISINAGRDSLRLARTGCVFGSLPSWGTRSAHLSAYRRLAIAKGNRRPHAPKCRALIPGIPCNTSSPRLLRSLSTAQSAAVCNVRSERQELHTIGASVNRLRRFSEWNGSTNSAGGRRASATGGVGNFRDPKKSDNLPVLLRNFQDSKFFGKRSAL